MRDGLVVGGIYDLHDPLGYAYWMGTSWSFGAATVAQLKESSYKKDWPRDKHSPSTFPDATLVEAPSAFVAGVYKYDDYHYTWGTNAGMFCSGFWTTPRAVKDNHKSWGYGKTFDQACTQGYGVPELYEAEDKATGTAVKRGWYEVTTASGDRRLVWASGDGEKCSGHGSKEYWLNRLDEPEIYLELTRDFKNPKWLGEHLTASPKSKAAPAKAEAPRPSAGAVPRRLATDRRKLLLL